MAKHSILCLVIILRNTSFGQAYSQVANYITFSHGFYSQSLISFMAYTESQEFTSGFYKIYDQNLKYSGPYSLKAEFSVSDKIGFGPYLGYEQMDLTVLDSGTTATYKVDYVVKSLSIALRANYHFETNSEIFDPFVGLGLGFNMNTVHRNISEEPYSNTSSNTTVPGAYSNNNVYTNHPTFFSATAGVRVYFHPKAALVIETGWEKSAKLHVGLVYKTRRSHPKADKSKK